MPSSSATARTSSGATMLALSGPLEKTMITLRPGTLAASRSASSVVQQIKARLREGNLLIQVYRKSGPLGVCPCQRYSQSALYHGVWIGRIQIRRVWIGQGRNNAVHVEDQVRATGWEYGPGVELGNQGNAPYGPDQGVQIFQGDR